VKHRNGIELWSLLCLVAACLTLVSAPAVPAQEQDGTAAEPDSDGGVPALAEGVSSAEPAAEADKEDGEDKENDGDNDDELVAINLNKVNVEKLVKFLTEITGKPVNKHKDVKAEITVMSPMKVSHERAFSLICDALLLEKVAVVESADSVTLVPVDMLSEVVVELLPGDTDGIAAGITRTVIRVKFADVEEIEKLIKPLLSKNGTCLAHPASKNIIITDTVSRVTNIESVVALLDVLEFEDRQVEIFTLKHADAEIIAPILKSVLGILSQKANGQQAGQPKPGQPPQPQQKGKPGPPPGEGVLDVVPYKDANWLVVVMPKELLEPAKHLVEQLDRERPQELTLRLIAIRYANPSEVASQLTPLFNKRPEKKIRDTVEITAHERSSSLVVLSSEENYEVIKEIVAQLDTEESVQMMTRTYELEHADAADISEQMNSLYSGLEQGSSRRSYWGGYYGSSRQEDDKTRFVPERRTNSVIAIARPTEFTKIDELIKKLDKPIDADEVAPRIFRIRYVDAKDLTDVLNEIFGAEDSSGSSGYYDYWYGRNDDDDDQVGRLYGKVRFVPETTTNCIIVTTNNNENFAVIEDFIKDLDQFSPDAANTMVIRLQNAKAEDIADQLNSLFAAEGARAPAQNQQQEEQRSSYYAWLYGSNKKTEERAISNLIGQVRVVPDKRTNSLTITTAVQNFDLIKDLVLQLDEASPKVRVQLRFLEVTTTRASRVGTRFTSQASLLESEDFDNGIMSTFGLSWADVYEDGTISANSDLSISLLVQFMQRHADARVLSEPTLVMNNNEEGSIFVGAQIPKIKDSGFTPEGTLNQSFEYMDAGTTLKITPTINELDRVEMNIDLESSQIRPGEVLFGAFIIDTRKFKTELAVETGDTIVIGGIMRQSESEANRRVPILGYIPIVNLAFRKKDTKKETVELIAFVTPTVLRDPEQDDAATRDTARQVEGIRRWRQLPDGLDDLNAPPTPWWKNTLGIEQRLD
jgi:type II secretory pathway component GspD/PulD (secretin)